MGDIADEYDQLIERARGEAYFTKRKKKTMAYKRNNTNVADLEKETIVVEFSGNGQYGPYLKANGEFYGMNEPLTDADFQKGEAYSILIKRGKPSEKNPGGKKYIVQLTGDGKASQAAPTVKPTNAAPTPTPEAAKKAYTEKEDAKNSRILWQGVVQAVAQSPIYAGADAETFLQSVKDTSEKLVAFILEKAGA